MSLRSAAVAIVVILCACCHGASEPGAPETRPSGAMSYFGYDDAGRLVVDGWIELDLGPVVRPPSPLSVSGTWKLRALADPARIGPQDGSGILSGSFVESSAVVDLHPGQVDDNIQLKGTLSAGGPGPMSYKGSWSWITIAGVRAQGTFRASE
jgi:hypothetical protein